MNKWRLLLFAVFCIFQPTYTENLFNGRERCLQRPDFYRQDSRLLDHSKARPEVRVDRSFSERINNDGLRYSDRNNRDENIRSEDRRVPPNDRIRVSPFRQQITEHVDQRSLRNTKPELRNIREEREEQRSNTEREVRNVRLTRSLSQENRRNEREDRTRNTFFRDSRVVYAPNRRSVERRFDDIQDPLIRSRQGRDLNARRELRSRSRAREDVRDDSEISDRFVRRADSSRRNNERSMREFQSVPDNRRQNLRSETVIRETNNEIGRQRTATTSRKDLERRSAVQRETDESRAFQRESRESSDEASQRIVRFDDSRRQINERLTRAQLIVTDEIRRNNARLELSRDYKEEKNRRSPATINRAFERRESAQRTDESRQIRRKLRAYSDRAYEREIVQRRESDASRDSRKESRDSGDKTNARYTTSDDSIRQTNERRYAQAQRNVRSEFIRTHDNAEVNRRSSPFTRDDTERPNEANENRYLRREARNSDEADSRYNFHTSRNPRQVARENSRMDVTRSSEVVSRRISPVSERNVDNRVDYLQRRDTSREIRRETRAPRSEDGYVVRASNRRTNNVHNISERRESAETSDVTRQFRIESRRISDIRFENLAQRINERLQSQNRRERQRSYTPISDAEKRRFVAIARDVVETRERDNLDAQRNSRREVRDFVPIARDVVEKKERDNLEARRDFRRAARNFIPIARDVVEKRERDNLDARRNFRREVRDFLPIARDVVEKRERDNLDARRNFQPQARDVRLDDSSRRDSEIFARVRREVLSKRIRDTDIRALNELRQDSRRVDEDRRTARAIRDNRRQAREEIEPARYSIRDNESTKERSLDRTISMPIRRIQRDDKSRRERGTFDQRIRSSQNNRISKVERIMEVDRNVEHRVNRASQDYRFESRFIKNTFERNMERDSSKRLVDGNRQKRDSRVALSRDDQNSAKDTRDLQEEILSMPTHDVDEEESVCFKWQHLLYLLQAVYIVGLLAKPHAKKNFGKKTGFGIWSHSPKLIKVD
ncbi:titin homolog [Aricia agestis]|uniref:titin homolog n=1 Tax=Aricia agestis TaxID=91739 RepID=UPI001C20B7EB|nr:titin homolog [Aricia agestis]